MNPTLRSRACCTFSILAVLFAAALNARAQPKPQQEAANVKKPAPGAGLSITVDPTFGTGGYVIELLDAKAQVGALGRFLAIDQKGRAVIAGNSPSQKFSLARYTTDGKPDATFADQGKTSVCIEDNATVESAGNTEIQFTHGGAIDSKGRIVLIGKGAGLDAGRKWDFALLRFTPAGELDKTFANVGWRKFQAHESWNIGLAVAVSPDSSSLVAAGYSGATAISDPLLIRFNEAGEVDENFSATANGSLRWAVKDGTSATATAVAIDAQGRYVVAMNVSNRNMGSRWAVARLLPTGENDETFGEKGIWRGELDPSAFEEGVYSVSLDDAGRIVLGGHSGDPNTGMRRLAVARLTDRGQLDTRFGPTSEGHVIMADYSCDVNQRNGPRATVLKDRIAIVGSVNGLKPNVKCFGVAVIDDSGKNIAKIEPPRVFPGSKGADHPWGLAFDDSGRLLVGGASQAINNKMRFAVARYLLK